LGDKIAGNSSRDNHNFSASTAEVQRATLVARCAGARAGASHGQEEKELHCGGGAQVSSRIFKGKAQRAGMSRLLRLRLNMVGDHEPAAIDSLVDICDEPIDLADGAILHLRLSDLGSNLPSKIANHMNKRADEFNCTVVKRRSDVGFRLAMTLTIEADTRDLQSRQHGPAASNEATR